MAAGTLAEQACDKAEPFSCWIQQLDVNFVLCKVEQSKVATNWKHILNIIFKKWIEESS